MCSKASASDTKSGVPAGGGAISLFADAFRLDRESALSASTSGISPSIRRRSVAEDRLRHETGDERRALFFFVVIFFVIFVPIVVFVLVLFGIVFVFLVAGLVLVEIDVVVVIGGGLE